MRFVWLKLADDTLAPVNPELVRYLRPSRSRPGQVNAVFSAMPGGFDELELGMDVDEAIAALASDPDPYAWR